MNMHCASRLGWIRSSKEASPHAPEELADPAQAGSAASGRTTGTMPSQRLADRTPRAPARHRAKRSGLLLLATATLLLIPALAYADVPVATITGDGVVKEGAEATYDVALTLGGSGAHHSHLRGNRNGNRGRGLHRAQRQGHHRGHDRPRLIPIQRQGSRSRSLPDDRAGSGRDPGSHAEGSDDHCGHGGHRIAGSSHHHDPLRGHGTRDGSEPMPFQRG